MLFQQKIATIATWKTHTTPPITAAWKGLVHIQQDLVNLKVKIPTRTLEVKSS